MQGMAREVDGGGWCARQSASGDEREAGRTRLAVLAARESLRRKRARVGETKRDARDVQRRPR